MSLDSHDFCLVSVMASSVEAGVSLVCKHFLILALALLVNIHPYTSASDLLGFNFSLIHVKMYVNLTVKHANSKCTQNTLSKNDIALLMVQLKTPEQLGFQCASHSDMFSKSYTSTFLHFISPDRVVYHLCKCHHSTPLGLVSPQR